MYRKHQQENKLLLAYIKTKERLRSLQFNLLFHEQNQINYAVSWLTKIKQKIYNTVFRNSESAVLNMIPGVVSMLSFYF